MIGLSKDWLDRPTQLATNLKAENTHQSDVSATEKLLGKSMCFPYFRRTVIGCQC